MSHPISYEDVEDATLVEGAVIEVDGGMMRLTLYKDDGTTVVIEEEDELE